MRKLLLLPLLALAAGSAHAAGLVGVDAYAGAGIMSDSVQNIQGTGFNIDNTSFKVLAGARLSLLGAELDYYRLGNESRSFGVGEISANASAVAAYAVGYLPLPILDFYGKVGVDRSQLSGNSAARGLFQFSQSGIKLAWGVGAQAHYGGLLERLEYERLNIANTDGARIVSLSVAYDFL